MKGILRIGGAVALGGVVVLGAFYARETRESALANTGSVTVVTPRERTAIEISDTNTNGTPDWREELEMLNARLVPPPEEVGGDNDVVSSYEPPTTLTGKFSEYFFEQYLKSKMSGADLSNPEGLVANAVTVAEKSTESKRFSRYEITTIPDSLTTYRTYGNQIAEAMLTHSIENENEALILKRALETNNPEVLAELEPIKKVYTNVITDTLTTSVPEGLVRQHLDLLNALEAIRTDIEAMQMVYEDPLYALTRLKRYEDNATGLYRAIQDLTSALTQNGVRYAEGEPGRFFYMFDL